MKSPAKKQAASGPSGVHTLNPEQKKELENLFSTRIPFRSYSNMREVPQDLKTQLQKDIKKKKAKSYENSSFNPHTWFRHQCRNFPGKKTIFFGVDVEHLNALNLNRQIQSVVSKQPEKES